MKEPKIIATAAICTAALSGGFVFTQGPTKFDANEVYASVYQETNVMADEEIVEVVEEEVTEEVETEVEVKDEKEEVKVNKKPVVSKPNKINKPVKPSTSQNTKPQVQQSKPIQQPSEETTDKPIDKVEDNQESVDNSTEKPDQPNDNLQENPILEVDKTTDVENTSIDSVEEQVDSITE